MKLNYSTKAKLASGAAAFFGLMSQWETSFTLTSWQTWALVAGFSAAAQSGCWWQASKEDEAVDSAR